VGISLSFLNQLTPYSIILKRNKIILHQWMCVCMTWYESMHYVWNALAFFFAIDPHLVAMKSFCSDSTFFIWIIWNQFFGLISLWRNFFFYHFVKHYLSSVHEIVKGVRKAWISTRYHWWDDEDKLGSCPSLKVLNWF